MDSREVGFSNRNLFSDGHPYQKMKSTKQTNWTAFSIRNESLSFKSKISGKRCTKFMVVMTFSLKKKVIKWEQKSETLEKIWRTKNGWKVKTLARHHTVWEKCKNSYLVVDYMNILSVKKSSVADYFRKKTDN